MIIISRTRFLTLGTLDVWAWIILVGVGSGALTWAATLASTH